MVTLLETLTRPNVAVDSQDVPPGPNSDVEASDLFEDWSPWNDFTYSTLTRIFSRELRQEYSGDEEPTALDKDVRISNEETLEDLLRRFLSPIVNFALRRQPGTCHFGRGSRCEGPDIPDWSVISDACLDSHTGCYLNILPGDTKLSAKWWPTMITDGNYGEWRNVVLQVLGYMMSNSSRYGFIITDTCLVALRLTRREIGPGLASQRSDRIRVAAAPTTSHQRQSSDASMASMSSYASSYRDDNPMLWDYHDPEYAVVPWSSHGSHRLTIKLALWCLAMMAMHDNGIRYWYPDLDSWRSARNGFVHNTSGAKKSALSKGDKLQDSPSGGVDYATAEGSGANATTSTQSHSVPVGNVEGAFMTSDAGGVELSREAHQDGDGNDDADTEVDAPTKRKRVKQVRVEKHTLNRRLYFVDARGKDRDTNVEEWQRVEGGYELETSKFVYFTKRFP